MNETEIKRARLPVALISIFIFLIGGMVITGYITYSLYEKQHQTELERQLSAVAELKVSELTQWRRERQGDAKLILYSSTYSNLLRRFMAAPEKAELRSELRGWFNLLESSYGYDRVFLLDARGIERFSVSDSSETAPPELLEGLSKALNSRQLVFLDYYEDRADGSVHLALLVPFFEADARGRPLGALVLQVDPRIYLNPLVQGWPTPNSSAETMLVRRDGLHALFLTELKFHQDSAMKLRILLDRTDILSVKAALGQEGLLEGIDYRGRPALGYALAVPDSPWHLLARMDKAEVYLPLRERLWLTVVLIGVLFLGAGAGLALVWRRRDLRFYRERAERARELWDLLQEQKAGEKKIEHLNRVLQALREISQLTAREKDAGKLIGEACRLLFEHRGYKAAMIVLTDEAGKPRAWTQAGMGECFEPLEARLRAGELPPCCEEALKSLQSVHIEDRTGSCVSCPVASDCASNETWSCRLAHADKIYGCIVVAIEKDAIGGIDETHNVAEVADDLALALHSIEMTLNALLSQESQAKAEAELRQAQKMEAVGRLAGGVAHDFNNMLAVILGYSEAALAKLSLDEPFYKFFKEIAKAARRSADLTQQLLAFSRKQEAVLQAVNLNKAVEEQQEMLGRLIGENISFEFHPGKDLWDIRIDTTQVSQILANLAVNARDAIPDVGKVIIKTANLSVEGPLDDLPGDLQRGDYVLLEFADTGVGMDAETREHVFEPFFTTKDTGKGTGLGLATVYGIAKQNGGYIHLSSEPGRGTAFKFYFPRFRGEPAEAGEQLDPPSSRGSGTVLVVEDEEQILGLISMVLKENGYQILAVSSPEAALTLAEKHVGDIDLLLSDVVMPTMNGKELRDRVEKLRPGIRILFMSGYTADVIARRGVIEEGLNFLRKPFTIPALVKKVQEILEG